MTGSVLIVTEHSASMTPITPTTYENDDRRPGRGRWKIGANADPVIGEVLAVFGGRLDGLLSGRLLSSSGASAGSRTASLCLRGRLPRGSFGGRPRGGCGRPRRFSLAVCRAADNRGFGRRRGRFTGPAGEWRTVPGSNADTTSVTIDLAAGAAVAVNNATPPMVEWTIHLRARDVNGNAGGVFTTTVNATADGTTVPAVPLAGLAMLEWLLILAGWAASRGRPHEPAG